MPLIPAKCTQCGATLTIDPANGAAAICPFCGTAFVVEQSINNYNVTNQTTIGTVEHVEHLHVNDERSIEARLASAENSLSKLGNWHQAFDAFESVANDKSDEWRAWWGMVRAKTCGLTLNWREPELHCLTSWYNNAHATAPDDARADIDKAWDAYYARQLARRDEDYRKLGISDEDIARLRSQPSYQFESTEQRLAREASTARQVLTASRSSVKNGRAQLVVVLVLMAVILAWNLVRGTLTRGLAPAALVVLAAIAIGTIPYIVVNKRRARLWQTKCDDAEAQAQQAKTDLQNHERLEYLDARWTYYINSTPTWTGW